MGRPRSPIPLAERRRLARQKYRAKLGNRALRTVRLLLPASAATRLTDLAKTRGLSRGEVIADLLSSLRPHDQS